MGNSVSLLVLSGPSAEVSAEVDMDAVTGEWMTQYVLPFLWMGFVPDAEWERHAERLHRALEAGESPEADTCDVSVPWPLAEQQFRSRLPQVAAVWPEVREPAERFLADVASVAERTDGAAVRLQLTELVEMSWGDESDFEQYVTDIIGDAGLWSEPSRLLRGKVSEVHRAVEAAEPERSFLLGGEWSYGGAPAPRSAPPELPEPAERPKVPKPAHVPATQWENRYGPHGEDLWEAAEYQALVRAAGGDHLPWYWAVTIAVVFGLVLWLIVGMFTQSMLWAVIVGGVVLVGILTWWVLVVRRDAAKR
ncbi:hypothetical protein ACWGJ9_10790 [Curtobacterium citreum]